ncbi:MAG: YaaL family protein [Clostridiales bacterium]|nr:YaaL family protein [Clostridiales bacterium]
MRHFINSSPKPSRMLSITEAIQQAQIDLDCAYRNLDHALDPDLIDCYIYQLKSAQMRYHFLLHCARREEFSQN